MPLGEEWGPGPRLPVMVSLSGNHGGGGRAGPGGSNIIKTNSGRTHLYLLLSLSLTLALPYSLLSRHCKTHFTPRALQITLLEEHKTEL